MINPKIVSKCLVSQAMASVSTRRDNGEGQPFLQNYPEKLTQVSQSRSVVFYIIKLVFEGERKLII